MHCECIEIRFGVCFLQRKETKTLASSSTNVICYLWSLLYIQYRCAILMLKRKPIFFTFDFLFVIVKSIIGFISSNLITFDNRA